jgi:hypothetical protein
MEESLHYHVAWVVVKLVVIINKSNIDIAESFLYLGMTTDAQKPEA